MISNLKNKIFGRLLVLNLNKIIRTGKNKQQRYYWKCKCSCGKITIVRKDSLLSNRTQSCGCYQKEQVKKSKGRKTHGMKYTKFYKTWQHLKERCNNPNNNDYKYYGGRGIKYNPKWNDFLKFKEDMYFKYLYAKKQLKIKKLSIERINVNGNYYKENCCFIELKDQSKNRRNVKLRNLTEKEFLRLFKESGL